MKELKILITSDKYEIITMTSNVELKIYDTRSHEKKQIYQTWKILPGPKELLDTIDEKYTAYKHKFPHNEKKWGDIGRAAVKEYIANKLDCTLDGDNTLITFDTDIEDDLDFRLENQKDTVKRINEKQLRG